MKDRAGRDPLNGLPAPRGSPASRHKTSAVRRHLRCRSMEGGAHDGTRSQASRVARHTRHRSPLGGPRCVWTDLGRSGRSDARNHRRVARVRSVAAGATDHAGAPRAPARARRPRRGPVARGGPGEGRRQPSRASDRRVGHCPEARRHVRVVSGAWPNVRVGGVRRCVIRSAFCLTPDRARGRWAVTGRVSARADGSRPCHRTVWVFHSHDPDPSDDLGLIARSPRSRMRGPRLRSARAEVRTHLLCGDGGHRG